MRFKQVSVLSSKVLLAFVQIIIILVCVFYMELIYSTNILPDKLAKETFVETSCQIMSKQLATIGHVIHRYRASFLVNYAVNDIHYESWVTGNGLDQSYFHERSPQEAVLASFQVNSSYPCWYDPQAPQIVVLVLRHNWMSTLPLTVPTLIALIVGFYLIKNISQMLGFFLSSRQEKKKRFKH